MRRKGYRCEARATRRNLSRALSVPQRVVCGASPTARWVWGLVWFARWLLSNLMRWCAIPLIVLCLCACREAPDIAAVPAGRGWECGGPSPLPGDLANCYRACGPGQVESGDCHRASVAYCFTFTDNDRYPPRAECLEFRADCEQRASGFLVPTSTCGEFR